MRKGSRKGTPSTEYDFIAQYAGGFARLSGDLCVSTAPQCLRGRPPRSGSGRARALLAISPRKSPRGAVSVISLPRTGSFLQACGLACVSARSAKLPAAGSACTVIAAPSDESTMPHTTSDIGFMMKTPLRTGIGPLANFTSYASARKHAVNIGKELFPGFLAGRNKSSRGACLSDRNVNVRGDSARHALPFDERKASACRQIFD